MAEINRRVLLIDADMRIPRLHKIFDITNSWGLSDVLYDRIPIEDYPKNQSCARPRFPISAFCPVARVA